MSEEEIVEIVKKMKKIQENEKYVVENYSRNEIFLYCFYRKVGRDMGLTPMQLISDPRTFIKSVYEVRESNIDPKTVKQWPIEYADVQAAFRKIENDNLLMVILKEYELL